MRIYSWSAGLTYRKGAVVFHQDGYFQALADTTDAPTAITWRKIDPRDAYGSCSPGCSAEFVEWRRQLYASYCPADQPRPRSATPIKLDPPPARPATRSAPGRAPVRFR